MDLDTRAAALTTDITWSFVKMASETTNETELGALYKIPLGEAKLLRWMTDRAVLRCTEKNEAASL